MDANDLVKRCLEGNERAWRQLRDLIRPVCIRLLAKALGTSQPDMVEDLEQEVYFRLLARDCAALRELQGAASLSEIRVFAATIALNLARDQLRRDVTKSGALDELEARAQFAAADAEDAAARAERLRLILDVAMKVAGGPESRAMKVFVAYFFGGFRASEIADLDMGLSTSGVESVIHRTSKQIRNALSKRGVAR